MDRLGLVLLALVVLLWGAGPLAVGVAVGPDGGFGPLWLNATRLMVAAGVLAGVARARGLSLSPGRAWPRVLALGVGGWALGSGLQIIAQTAAPSGLAALILGAGPAITLALESGLDRRMPRPAQLIGLALAIVGLGLVVQGDLGSAPPWAIGLLVCAALAWALAALIHGRAPDGLMPTVSAAWQMFAGAVGLAVAALSTGEPLPTPSPTGWAAWTYLALAGAAVGFLLWVDVLRRLPVTTAMLQPLASTLVALFLGVVILGEPAGPQTVLGVAVAVAGIGLTLGLPLPVLTRRLPLRVRALNPVRRRR